MRGHSHKYTDYALFRASRIPEGFEVDWTEAWTNHGHNGDDYHCQKESDSTSYGGEETRPKNIRVVYIIKIF